MAKNIGIDLGASTALMYLSENGRIIEEPAILAVSENGDDILAAGSQAKALCGRIPGAAKIVYPFRSGTDPEHGYFLYFIRYMIKKSGVRGIFHPDLLLCIDGDVSESQEEVIFDTVHRCGIHDVMVINKMTAIMSGVCADMEPDQFYLLADVGGSETCILLIKDGSCVRTNRIRVGGDSLDASIAGYIAEKYGIRINFSEAERIKNSLGGVWKRDSVITDRVSGTNISDGLPNSVVVDSKEIFGAISPSVKRIAVGICDFIDDLSDAEYSDIEKNGIMLGGGGSLLYGFREFIEAVTEVPASLAKDPVALTAIGFKRLFENM